MTTQILTRPIFDLGLSQIAHKIARVFGSIAAAQQAANEFERMNNRTDAQLATHGMARADVARMIFEKHYG